MAKVDDPGVWAAKFVDAGFVADEDPWHQARVNIFPGDLKRIEPLVREMMEAAVKDNA